MKFQRLTLIYFILIGAFLQNCHTSDNSYSYRSKPKKGGRALSNGWHSTGSKYSGTSRSDYRNNPSSNAGTEQNSGVQETLNTTYNELARREHPVVAAQYETYASYAENKWILAKSETKSTFSIDVDNASYTNFRRYITNGQLPPKDAVRVEEWMNFFNYELEAPTSLDEHPIKITSEIAPCPWNDEDDLLMLKLQGELPPPSAELPPSNLVFLLDVSGSMNAENKLPLLQESMLILVNQMRAQDFVSIVTYAGSSEIMLSPTPGDKKDIIISAINRLQSGGGTAGAEGITTAYKLGEENFNKDGNNRIIIASDGDWNIGEINKNELVKVIEKKRETGIYLSVLGFGMYNLNDELMEQLADNGNGNYAYIDSKKEANRIFNTEFAGALYVIAKDVKLQIEFDSTLVESYRLLGYENRVLENWQFEADSIDAGDLGMGQNVVAFYQIKRKNKANKSIGKVDFRYKPLQSDQSVLVSHKLATKGIPTSDFNFASCVIEFSLCLKESEYRTYASMQRAIQRGRENLGDETNTLSHEKRVEFVGLMEKAEEMWTGYVIEKAPEVKIDNAPVLKLYPNPATDFITIEVPTELSGKWSVQLFSMSGKLEKVIHFKENKLGRIEVNDLPKGTYIAKVYGQGFNYGYLRLIVE